MNGNNLERVTVVLPSLDPCERIESVVSGLIDEGFRDILIINDGSREEKRVHFERLALLPECHVLTHDVNRGKGAGLKNAFQFFLENRPDYLGVVTVDGDGQHLPKDVKNCALEMLANKGTVTLGVRSFARESVPFKSYWGNTITSAVFRILCGIKLSDTQTGLRAIPAEHLPLMLTVVGNRFEYETNMLLSMKRENIPFLEVPIETVYEGTNEGSHFRPFADSLRIYALILKYAASGIGSFVIDILLFRLALQLLGVTLGSWNVIICTVIARAISSFVNFNTNRRLVFESRTAYQSAIFRYYMLCIPQMLVSAGLVWSLSRLSSNFSAYGLLTVMKIVVDTALFFLSFQIQREWVFKQKLDGQQ